ncbi:MAG: type I-U CRISPR-associated RAMP protein Csb1/Cas7u [Acidobacteriota bacterium]
MPIDYTALQNSPRLLMEAQLRPLQGDRFQPTGFADLGPARYTAPHRRDNGDMEWVEMLLLESAQSVANRMELACCQEDKRTLLTELDGLPYVRSTHKGEVLTTSYLEAHRLSSPYLLNDEWAKTLATELNLRDDFPLNDQKIFRAFFKFDPCCLLHGVWLSLEQYKKVFSGGRVRVTRTLSGFIEARNVRAAENGGTKFDKNAARTEEEANAKTGYGTLPFHRTEFTAESITAYFNLDLALLRGYRLEEEATKLLIALALLKIQRFLSTGLKLRTACNLQMLDGLAVKTPTAFVVPQESELLTECRQLIRSCGDKGLFARPCVTEFQYQPKKADGVQVPLPPETAEPQIPEELQKSIRWKKGTKKKAPALEFVQGLDPAIAQKAKGLFSDNQPVQDAIDKALTEKSEQEEPPPGEAEENE